MVDFLEKGHFFVLEKDIISLKHNFRKFYLKNPAEIISAEILKIQPKFLTQKFLVLNNVICRVIAGLGSGASTHPII